MSVLLVAPPGIRRNSLLSLLRAQIEAESIRLADDIHAAEAALLEAGAHFLIADTALSQAVVLDLIRSVREMAPTVHFIALTDGSEDAETLLAAGAAKVLYRGVLDEEILHAALTAGRKRDR
jgi:DNA-binding NarL/FixJ family response regulator